MIARSLALALVLTFAALAPAAAAGFTVPPRPTEYVTDGANALSSTATTAVTNELKNYEDKTGTRILVWIGQTTGDVPLETWTTQTADTWKVGRKNQEDGAVLFLFMKDHKVRIEVGYGLEGKLPDATAFRIIQDDIVPKMRDGDTDGAVEGGVTAMLTAITPDYASTLPTASPEPQNSPAENAIVTIFIIIFVLLIVLGIVITIVRAARFGWWIVSGATTGNWHSSGSSGWSGGGGGWSGGGGGGLGGGGFGGGFGGGGASGSW